MKYAFPKILFAASILFVAVSSALFVFLYVKIKNDNAASATMQTEWQNEEAKRADMQSLQSAVLSVADERASLATHFIQSSDVVPFLDMIEGLAPESGAKAEVLVVDASSATSSLAVQVKATGTFQSVYKFLTLLENSPYELDFSTVDFQTINAADVKAGASSQWSGSFTIKLLSFTQ